MTEASDDRKLHILARDLRRRLQGRVNPQLLARIDDQTLVEAWHLHNQDKLRWLQEQQGQQNG